MPRHKRTLEIEIEISEQQEKDFSAAGADDLAELLADALENMNIFSERPKITNLIFGDYSYAITNDD
jgi:hypothetical protein